MFENTLALAVERHCTIINHVNSLAQSFIILEVLNKTYDLQLRTRKASGDKKQALVYHAKAKIQLIDNAL